jgi:hypothetical protein
VENAPVRQAVTPRPPAVVTFAPSRPVQFANSINSARRWGAVGCGPAPQTTSRRAVAAHRRLARLVRQPAALTFRQHASRSGGFRSAALRPSWPSPETDRRFATSPSAEAHQSNDAHPSVRRDLPRRLVTADPPTPVVVARSEWVCRSGRGCRKPGRSLQRRSPHPPQTRSERTWRNCRDHATLEGPAAAVLDARSVRRNRGWCASGSPQRCMGGIWLSPAS